MTIFVTATTMTSDLTPVRTDLDPCHHIWQITTFPVDLPILHAPGVTRALALTVMDYAEHLAVHDPDANGIADHKCPLTQQWDADLTRYLRQIGYCANQNTYDFDDEAPF